MRYKKFCVFVLFGFVLPAVICQRDSLHGRPRGRPSFPPFSRFPSNRNPGNQRFSGPPGRSRPNNVRRRPGNHISRGGQRGRSEIIIEFRNNNGRQFEQFPGSNGRKINVPGSNSGRNPSFNSISGRDHFQNEPHFQGQPHPNSLDFRSQNDMNVQQNNQHFDNFNDVNSRRDQHFNGRNRPSNGPSRGMHSPNNGMQDHRGPSSDRQSFDRNQGSQFGPNQRDNNISPNMNTNGRHFDNSLSSSQGHGHFGNNNQFGSRQSGHTDSLHGQRSNGNSNRHDNGMSSKRFDNINTGVNGAVSHSAVNRPIDVNLNSEVIGSVNTVNTNTRQSVGNLGFTNSAGNSGHNVNSMGIQNHGSLPTNTGHFSNQHASQNGPPSGPDSSINSHIGNMGSPGNNKMANQINGILSVPLNQAHQSVGQIQQTNLNVQQQSISQTGVGHQNTINHQIGPSNQNTITNNVAALKNGNNLINPIPGQASSSINLGTAVGGITSHAAHVQTNGISIGNNGATSVTQTSGNAGALGATPAGGLGGNLPIDINNTIEKLSNLIASNVSPGLQALSAGKTSIGTSTTKALGGTVNIAPAKPVIEPIDIDYEEILQRAMADRILGGLNVRG